MRYKKRITNLKADIAAQDLDGLLVVKKENIRYLCGLEAEDSSLYISSRNRDYIITDSRFRQEAKDLLTGLDIKLKESSGVNALNEIPSLGRLKRLGFESDHLSFSHYREIKRSLKKTKLVPTRMLIENLRLIKDTEEVRLIKKAIEITKSAYCQAIDTIKPGNNALESAMRIDNYMRENGASSPAFKTIVAEAPFSSRPHAQPIDVPFKKNSSILIDMGAVYNGYNSDLTRLLFLGRITPKFKRIYNIIYTAQKKALEEIRPGIKISRIDRAARSYIEKKGFGKQFLHSLGHGTGLEIHESPRISKGNNEVLMPGMVFTIEPGIYIEGWGGVRLEDMVLVTKDGREVLTDDISQ